MTKERGRMVSNNAAKPKPKPNTIKDLDLDLDLNDSNMNEIKVVYTPNFLNQFRSPPITNACINLSKSCTLYATYLSKFSSLHKKARISRMNDCTNRPRRL
jgi:hypothetical protein